MAERAAAYEAVIGLEVHAQLSTATKLFCGCRAAYGGEPNTRVCPVCLGLPGALPVVNATAVEYAVRAGLAMNCTIAPESVFARKNYFYPDCPKNYQISQYETPLCTGGYVVIGGGGHVAIEGGGQVAVERGAHRVRITRIHLEEDAGKLVHDPQAGFSLVDLNRCGVPLIEIVSEPDMRTPAQAREYVQKLRSILRYLDVCDGNMEQGSLRCDINVSVRRKGQEELGIKTEIKNVNSFKFIEQALEFEIDRQCGILEGGGSVTQDTLLWDASRGRAEIMRTKEEAQDYRYFPEPDLPLLRAPAAMVAAIAAGLPELPDARSARFEKHYGLPSYDAGVLTSSRELADYFESVASACGDAKTASNWVMGEVLRELNERQIEIGDFDVTPEDLAGLITTLQSGRVNTPTAKEVFKEMAATGRPAAEIIAEKGLEQITDDDVIGEAARRAIEDNPDAVAKYLAGKEALLKFFVGQVMKATRGKANPQQVESVLKKLLDGMQESG
jgi:aspartyl-tRNA(Asn)/glutamyl-tRNA(Gln) amidotransferase subunit B